MNAFIEQYKKLFKFYYTALRLSGWLLLILGFCSFIVTMILVRMLGAQAFAVTAINMPLKPSEFILFGLLGLGIAQLIRHLLTDCKPGFILCHGCKLLYAYALLIFYFTVMRNICTIVYLRNSDAENAPSLFIVTSIASLVLCAAKALILIGLAQFLKRIMSVIEEHKTLV